MSIQKAIAFTVTGLTFFELWVYREPLISSMLWFSDLHTVTESIRGFGLWGPAVLFVLFILQTFLAFIPGQALMVSSGYIYGFTGGILLTWISLVAGGQAAFWLARRYGRPFAERWVSAPVLDRWDKSAAGQGIGFYVITLVMPFFPNDAMCYVAGLGNMSFRRFLTANILGRGIASFLTVLIGAFSEQIPGLVWIAIVIFIVLGIAGWFVARRYSNT
jgi:uncharacterized membrane protein YdjX (TVP38/TMEM64 family)